MCNIVNFRQYLLVTLLWQENEADSWGVVQKWLLRLKAKGISTMIIRHAGKSGDNGGTSRMEDAVDTVVKLEEQKRHSAQDGYVFSVKYTKHRHFFGDDARGFTVKLDSEVGFVVIEKENDEETKQKEKKLRKAEHELWNKKLNFVIKYRNQGLSYDAIVASYCSVVC